MGEVFKAYDTKRDRYVALKLLPPALSGDDEYLSRFQRESHVVARLRDPHVIPIHDFGEIDGQLFIDMRLVDGTDIGALLQASGPIAPQRAAYLISQIAEALDAAHADNLIHRDIKPSNVLVTPTDFVYVVDFGIARSMGDRQTALTVTGATIGTLNYMAPERFAGGDIDGRADVYSLACVLHECLTGATPFTGKDLPSLIYAHLYSGPERASTLVPGIPPALDDVIARGMAKDPADRFPTAGQLAAAVREAVAGGTPTQPVTTPPRTTGWNEIPASAWVSATEAWQAVGEPQAPKPPPPVPPAKPAVDRPVRSGSATPTQTVMAVNFDGRNGTRLPGNRPPENPPPPIDPEPYLEPDPGPYGGPQFPPPGERERRRRGGFVYAGAAVVLVVAVAVIAFALTRSHTGTPTPTADTGTATKTAAAPSSAPAVAVPKFAETVTVGQSPSFIRVAPNGKFAYVTDTSSHSISVLSTANDQVSATIKIPEGPPQSVSFSNDSKTAYVSVYNTRGSVHLVAFIDTATNKVTGTVNVTNHEPGPSAISPDGKSLYVPNHNMTMTPMSAGGDDDIDVIDTATLKLVDTITVQPNPHWIAFGSGGLFYVTNHMSGKITIVNSRTNKVEKTMVVGETPHSITISPDGKTLAITSYSGKMVFLVDVATEKITQIPVGRLPLDIAYSPDGRYLLTANNEDSTVSVISTADNRVIATLPAGKNPTSISVLPDGKQAYVTDQGDGTVEVLNLPK
jgi:serine/threonine-protein kinase